MARTKRQYERLTQAEDIIKDLTFKYKDALWRITPSSIMVLSITNSERSDKNHCLAKVKLMKGVEQAVMELNNIKVRYVIELYGSDWKIWTQAQRQWILFHELMHVHEEGDKLIKHDCEDFKLILDAAGLNWVDDPNLVNMLNNKIDFDLDLRPGLKDSQSNDDPREDEDEKIKEESVVFEPEE